MIVGRVLGKYFQMISEKHCFGFAGRKTNRDLYGKHYS